MKPAQAGEMEWRTAAALAVLAACSLAGCRTAPPASPSSGSDIRGTVRDCTPEYSEARFAHFERVVKETLAREGAEEAGRDDDLSKTLMELIGPRGPMSHVTVTLRSQATARGARDVVRKTATDAVGRFAFAGVPAGDYEVTAEFRRGWLAGKARIRRRIEHLGYKSSHLDFDYHPRLASVRGRITDTSGRPLPSARVTATHYAYNAEIDESPIRSHAVSTVTARDGTFELRGLLPGQIYFRNEQYEIRVEAAGYVTAERRIPVMTEEVRTAAERLWRILMLGFGDEGEERMAEWRSQMPTCRGPATIGVDFVLGKPATLAGRVTDPQGQPQPCEVHLIPARDAPAPLARDALVPKPSKTDEQDAFAFHDVPAGEYTVRVAQNNRAVDIDGMLVTLGEGQASTGLRLVLDLQPVGRLDATVLEKETGKPIANFTASVWNVRSPRECWASSGELVMNTAGPGTFSVTNMSPGDAELEIAAPGYAPEHLHVEIPSGQSTPLLVHMVRAGTAAVQVTRDGVPFPPAENLQAFSVETGAIVYGRAGPKDDGSYEIPGLKPGRYVIRAHVFEEGRTIHRTRYETAPVAITSDSTNRVTIDFSGNSALAISLAFPAGLGAQVYVESPDAPHGQPLEKNVDLRAYVWADRPGHCELKHLRPGTYRVRAQLQDRSKAKPSNAAPPPEQCQTITLQDGKTILAEFRF
jgi:protocatechuate 3,4-dioxygenase beta subunit